MIVINTVVVGSVDGVAVSLGVVVHAQVRVVDGAGEIARNFAAHVRAGGRDNRFVQKRQHGAQAGAAAALGQVPQGIAQDEDHGAAAGVARRTVRKLGRRGRVSDAVAAVIVVFAVVVIAPHDALVELRGTVGHEKQRRRVVVRADGVVAAVVDGQHASVRQMIRHEAALKVGRAGVEKHEPSRRGAAVIVGFIGADTTTRRVPLEADGQRQLPQWRRIVGGAGLRKIANAVGHNLPYPTAAAPPLRLVVVVVAIVAPAGQVQGASQRRHERPPKVRPEQIVDAVLQACQQNVRIANCAAAAAAAMRRRRRRPTASTPWHGSATAPAFAHDALLVRRRYHCPWFLRRLFPIGHHGRAHNFLVGAESGGIAGRLAGNTVSAVVVESFDRCRTKNQIKMKLYN